MNTKLINSIVSEFISEDKPFTAYTIFEEAKKQNATLRYFDLRKNIHEAVKCFVSWFV
jgi:hypothetical protein